MYFIDIILNSGLQLPELLYLEFRIVKLGAAFSEPIHIAT